MLYYKRLEPEAFAILQQLGAVRRLERACVAALAKSTADQRRLVTSNPGMVPRLVCARLVLPENKMRGSFAKPYRWLIAIGNALRSPILLLVIRLYWGWQFFLTGKGKLADLAKPTQYFESLGIPFRSFRSDSAGCVECFGGLLLLVGLATG